MSRLRLNTRVAPKVQLRTRVLLGAGVGLTLGAMLLFVGLRQSKTEDETPSLRTFTKSYPDLSFKKIIATHDGNLMASDGTNFYKIDTNGNVLWSARVPSPQPVMIQELVETTDFGVAVVAQTTGQESNSRIYIIKMKKDGTFAWSKTLEKTQSEFAYGACASEDNGIYLCGSGCATFNYVLKLNANGDQVWVKDFKAPDADANAQRILKTDAGLMLAGRFRRNNADFIYIARLNLSGQWLGGKIFTVPHSPSIKSFVKSNDGSLLLAGQFVTPTASPFIMKMDAVGNPTWFKMLASDNVQSINGIAATNDNSVLCIGNAFVNTNENVNMLLTKLDANGNLLWNTTMGSDALNGAGYDDLYSVAPLTGGRFMLAGSSAGGLLTMTDAAGNGFCHYTPFTVTAQSLPIQTQILSLAPIPTQLFTSTAMSLASSYTTVASPSVCYGNFNGKDNTGTTETQSENAATEEITVRLYPNPTQGICNMEIKNLNTASRLTVYDLAGRTMLQQELESSQPNVTFDLEKFTNGTYVISLKSNDAVLYQDQIVLQK